MPELPEVEVTKLGLEPLLPGRTVKKVSWSSKRLRVPMPRTLLSQYIYGSAFISIDRRGKFLLLRMVNKSVLVIHLGMTGKLSAVSSDLPPAKHDHLRLLLDNKTELRFNDSRRFGSISVWPSDQASLLERKLSDTVGVEPFSRKMNADYLLQSSLSRTQPVKNFLMDGKIVAGIGNIYANEILFDVKIHPQAPANSITRSGWNKVVASSRKILKKAILAGGSTISDFLGTSGNPGYFQLQLNVYGRKGKRCTKCKSSIHKIVLAGRATFYCPGCQLFPDTVPKKQG